MKGTWIVSKISSLSVAACVCVSCSLLFPLDLIRVDSSQVKLSPISRSIACPHKKMNRGRLDLCTLNYVTEQDDWPTSPLRFRPVCQRLLQRKEGVNDQCLLSVDQEEKDLKNLKNNYLQSFQLPKCKMTRKKRVRTDKQKSRIKKREQKFLVLEFNSFQLRVNTSDRWPPIK